MPGRNDASGDKTGSDGSARRQSRRKSVKKEQAGLGELPDWLPKDNEYARMARNDGGKSLMMVPPAALRELMEAAAVEAGATIMPSTDQSFETDTDHGTLIAVPQIIDDDDDDFEDDEDTDEVDVGRQVDADGSTLLLEEGSPELTMILDYDEGTDDDNTGIGFVEDDSDEYEDEPEEAVIERPAIIRRKTIAAFGEFEDTDDPTTETPMIFQLEGDDGQGLSESAFRAGEESETDELETGKMLRRRGISQTGQDEGPDGGKVSFTQGSGARESRRYVDLGLIAVGGMGEVRRVYDRDLNRVLALKVILPELMDKSSVVSRFVSEAQATGQLQHPGIVPVHEIGRLADGRYYFTMREIRGKHLGEVINDFHTGKTNRFGEVEYTLRKVIDIIFKVCEATGYAHSRHVIHRDIKPENVLVGEFGEVLLVDWGLAKVMDERPAAQSEFADVVVTDRSEDKHTATMVGSIAGTPAYMPIEQAIGDQALQGPPSDVYALGAILYEALSGRPPYQAKRALDTLKLLLSGPPTPLSEGPEIPAQLREICQRAMSRKTQDRYPSAVEMAEQLTTWLDGVRRRSEALAMLSDAHSKHENIRKLRQRAVAKRAEAMALLDGISDLAPEAAKHPGWDRIDDAAQLDQGADMLEVLTVQVARAALGHDPDLAEAHAFLAKFYKEQHQEAELQNRRTDAERAEALLRAHDTGIHSDYLKGVGAVTLVTDPPGARVEIFRYVEKNRRFHPQFVAEVETPLEEYELPMGSYVFVLTLKGKLPVRYPVHVGRQEHWDGIPPGASEPLPILLPDIDELAAGEIYVPAGYFTAGGDPRAANSIARQRIWSDGFVIMKNPVTNDDYVRFLGHLVKYRREKEAAQYAPASGGQGGLDGPVYYEIDDHGMYWLPLLDEGTDDEEEYGGDLPVLMLTWHAAMAYAQWHAKGAGKHWRLPHELEWEKAARGVDGRSYPMGNFLDPIWACMGLSHRDKVVPRSIHEFAIDESPYGVRGMAGNVRDWCRTQYLDSDLDILSGRLQPERVHAQADGPVYRSVRGGTWSGTADECRAGGRGRFGQGEMAADVSIRLVREFGHKYKPND